MNKDRFSPCLLPVLMLAGMFSGVAGGQARSQDMYGPIFDKTFAIDRSSTLDGRIFTGTAISFTDKFYGYYFYQFDQANNKLLVRVRTTNDRSRPPKGHYIACGTMTFLAGGRTVVVAYHLYPANNVRRTYIDDRRGVDVTGSDLAAIDKVTLRAGWCRGTPDRMVHFRSS
jgi:hypothetical protein